MVVTLGSMTLPHPRDLNPDHDYPGATRTQVRFALIGIPLLWVVLMVVLYQVVVFPQLPAEVPTHYGLDGTPDAYRETTRFSIHFIGLAVMAGASLGALVPGVKHSVLGRTSTAQVTFAGLGVLSGAAVAEWLSLSRGNLDNPISSLWLPLVGLGLGVALCGLILKLLPPPADHATTTAPSLPQYLLHTPTPTRQVIEVTRTFTSLALLSGALILTALIFAIRGATLAGMFLLLGGLLCYATSRITVRVDADGVLWRSFGTEERLPLRQISGVSLSKVDFWSGGGIGGRFDGERLILALQFGTAVRLQTTGLPVTIAAAEAEEMAILLAQELHALHHSAASADPEHPPRTA